MDGGLWHCTGDRDQDHPCGKEMQKSKMAVWGGLTNSCEKKRSEKQRRKGERYKHLNAEFQRIARRHKKAFLSDQCQKIEENNRMGKTRDLFKKIRDTKGIFHANMGSIKDRSGGVLVLEGLVCLHRTVQLQFLQHYWSGDKLGFLWYWMVCLGNKQRSFCNFWDCISVLYFGLFWWLWWLLHFF